MAPVPPSVRRQRVGAELKRLREDAGLSLRQAAERTKFSTSKISRIETAKGAIQGDDVYTLCKAYGVSLEVAEDLIERTRQSRHSAWWHEYSPDALGNFADFIELELDAQRVHEFEADTIPGQLQTSAYAEAVIRLGRPDLSDEVVEQRVALRMERQQQRADDSPHMWAILDEAALLRPVGGPAVMADQLEHLAQLARHPRTKIQVIPLSVPGHASLGVPFTLLTLRGGQEYTYRDGARGGSYTDDADEVSVYREIWSLLSATAADFDRSLVLINQAEAKHRRAAHGEGQTS